ncbi:MAG TPA: hypothetical protein VG125_11785, partial [Pirellulales bacterium]|nr:hypothetical protein [Pirellulales bacterium]
DLTTAAPPTQPLPVLLTGVAAGETITGMAFLNNLMFAVGNLGHLYTVDIPTFATLTTKANLIGNVGGLSLPFSGLSDGPPDVENGKYAKMLFTTAVDPITGQNDLFAINADSTSATFGQLVPIFNGGTPASPVSADRVPLSVGNVASLAFSTLDYNLWHVSDNRKTDPGHGVNVAPDQSRNTLSPNKPPQNAGGSFYFGLEDPGNQNTVSTQPGAADYITNTQVAQGWKNETGGGSTYTPDYNVPGGAYGVLTTNSFSLANYSSGDQPTLYFNYDLNTEDASSTSSTKLQTMFDSARLEVSQDGGNTWNLLATNNPFRATFKQPEAELPYYQTENADTGSIDSGLGGRQAVQPLFDSTTTNTGWRQARIDLSDYAGQNGVKLRFDFSTAGTTFNPEDLSINAVTGQPNPYANQNVFGNQFGQFQGANNGGNGPEHRGLNNAHEGWYIDDVVVGFAERGEMVTGPAAGVTQYTSLTGNPFAGNPTKNPDPAAITEVQTGSYQLEIRRGTEYGGNVNNLKSDIALGASFDTNFRFADAYSLIAPSGTGLSSGETFTLNDGVHSVTFEFVTSANQVIPGDVPIVFSPTDTAQNVADEIVAAVDANKTLVNVSAADEQNGPQGVSNPATNIVNLFGVVEVSGASASTNRIVVGLAARSVTESSLNDTGVVTRTGTNLPAVTATLQAIDVTTGGLSTNVAFLNGQAMTTVSFLAGQASASFLYNGVVKGSPELADGTRTVLFKASAAGYSSIGTTLDVTDDPGVLPQFTVSLNSGSVAENGTPVTGTVRVNTGPVDGALHPGGLTVSLSSLWPTAALVSGPAAGPGAAQATVTIPVGATQASFFVLPQDDNVSGRPGGLRDAEIVAAAVGVISGNAMLTVTDDNDGTLGFGVPTWQPIGPAPILNGQTAGPLSVSGRITGIAADPKDQNTVYIAAAGGGVWKTINATAANPSWTPLTDNITDNNGNPIPEFMGAVAETDAASGPSSGHQIVYAGTGEANNSGGDTFYGEGILVSTDGGATWTVGTANGAFQGDTVSKIVIDPSDTTGATAYAATSDFGVNGGFGNTGVWKTTNYGVTWVNETAKNGFSTTDEWSDVVIDPHTPSTLYAADGTFFGTSGNGVYESTNSGVTWSLLQGKGTFNGTQDGRITLGLYDDGVTNELFVSISNPGNPFGALYKMLESTDGGNTFTDITSNLSNYLGGQGWYDTTLTVDPTNPNYIYAAGQMSSQGPTFAGSPLESFNGGKTWTDIATDAANNGPHTDAHAVAFDANGNLFDGDDGGIYQLSNPTNAVAQRWTSLNGNLAITQFTGIAVDPTNAKIVYGGSQDNGTEKYTGSMAWNHIDFGDGGLVRVDPTNPNTLYHTYAGGFLVISTDGGTTWNGISAGIVAKGTNFYPPFTLDSAGNIYYGSDNLNFSSNHGGSWSQIGAPGTNGFNPGDFAIDAVAVSPVNNNVVYVSANGSVFVTKNAQAGAANVTWALADLPGNLSTNGNGDFAQDAIAVDPSDASGGTAYAVVPRFTGGGSHVFKTTNFGGTWADISIPLDTPCNAVAVSSDGKTVYVGTDVGVYSTSNGGLTWTVAGVGMPNTKVTDLEYMSGLSLLAAGTHGRGAFLLSPNTAGATVSLSVTQPKVEDDAGLLTNEITVTRSDASSAATVTIASSDPALASVVPATITMGVGQKTATVNVQINDPTLAETPESVIFTATLGSAESSGAVLDVLPVVLKQALPPGSPPSTDTAFISAPTLLSATPSSTGGNLATGTYYYEVTAFTGVYSPLHGFGETTLSNELSATVQGPNGEVQVSWPAVPGAIGYEIYRGTASGGERLIAAFGAGPGILTYIDSISSTPVLLPPTVNAAALPSPPHQNAPTVLAGGNFPPGTYYYEITATTALGETTASISPPDLEAVANFQTGGSLGPATYYYVVTAVNGNGESTVSDEQPAVILTSTGSAGLNWAVAPGATGYRIFRGTSAGGENILVGTLVGNNGPNVDSFSDTGGSGISASPPTVNTASNEESIAIATGNSSVSLSWNAVAGATGYKIYRGTTSGAENALVATISSGAATSYVDSGAGISGAAIWTAIGPAPLNGNGIDQPTGDDSGRIVGVAPDPTNANTIYIAAAGGGVWKTTNGGTSWTPLTDNLKDSSGKPVPLFMGAIAVAPSNPSVIYAGTGEANNSGDSYYGDGILVSTNGGTGWTLDKGPNDAFVRRAVSKIAVDPTNSNVAYVAISDLAANGLGGNTGIWKTIDGGTNWTNTTAPTIGDTTDSFSDVVVDPNNPSTVYAAIGNPGGSPLNGIYKSTNGGTTWVLLGNFPEGIVDGRISLAISNSPGLLYAAVSGTGAPGSTQFGTLFKVEKSTDGGATWTDDTKNASDFTGGQGWYDLALTVDPHNSSIVYAAGSTNFGGVGIIETIDGGTTWKNVTSDDGGNFAHTDWHSMAFDDANDTLLVGSDGGLWRKDTDPGNAAGFLWTDLNGNLNTIQFYSIALDPTDAAVVVGGSQDNGTERYDNNLRWTQTDGGDGGKVAFDPQNPSLVYRVSPVASFGPADFFRVSNDGGQTWTSATSGLNVGFNINFTPPFAVAPSNGSEVILGDDNLWITSNGASTWSQLTSVGTAGWNPNDSAVDSIAIAPSDPNTIYASTGGQFASSSNIFVSSNGGNAWTEIDLPAGSGHVEQLAVDPASALIAYAVVNMFGVGHVYRTADGGQTWTNVSGNLPDQPSNAVAINTSTGAVYVGNDTGVFVSTNVTSGSPTWAPVGSGLPNAQVVDLEYNPTFGLLGAATHGRGAFLVSVGGAAAATEPNTASDNDTPALSLSVPAVTMVPGTLTQTLTATITRNTPTTGPLVVTILSLNTAVATVPATVTIPAGQASTTFTVAGVGAFSTTGNLTLTGSIVAAADGYLSSSAGVSSQSLDAIIHYNPPVPAVLGDVTKPRPQGEVILYGNQISNALNDGILVEPSAPGSPGNTNSNLPHPGGLENTPTLDTSRLADGVVIVNNLIYGVGGAGIAFFGNADGAGAPLAAVPFGRIVNNTIYGGASPSGVGINILNNASPTMLNNILANLQVGIQVDNSSKQLLSGPVLGEQLYQNDATVSNDGTGSFAIQLKPTDPLFINPSTNPGTANFYLQEFSKAIDSSINSLQDRTAVTAVTGPLGIPPSPIIAPATDLYGQLRVPDPKVAPFPGLGQNVFIDRGAIERVDNPAVGLTAALVNPAANSPANLSTAPNVVFVRGQNLSEFTIQLNDGTGPGVYDASLLPYAYAQIASTALGSNIASNTITVTNGGVTKTFEFTTGTLPNGDTNIPIVVSPGDSPATLAQEAAQTIDGAAGFNTPGLATVNAAANSQSTSGARIHFAPGVTVGVTGAEMSAGTGTTVDVIEDGRLLTPGVDYSFDYDNNNHVIHLVAASGVWLNGHEYDVYLDNGTLFDPYNVPATPVGITDRAGNLLQANAADGYTHFRLLLANTTNTAPVINLPANLPSSIYEHTSVTFSVAGGDPITIFDVDAGSGSETLTLTANTGTFTLSNTALVGLQSIGIDTSTIGNGTGTITITAPLGDPTTVPPTPGLDTALDGLIYTPDDNFDSTAFGTATTPMPATIAISVNDNGNSPPPAQTAAASISFNVLPVNDPPSTALNGVTITPPGVTLSTGEDVSIVFSAANNNQIAINDTDVQNLTLSPGDVNTAAVGGVLTNRFYNDPNTIFEEQITVSTPVNGGVPPVPATAGSVTLGLTTGLSFINGSSNGSPFLDFTGTLSAIDAAMSKLTFTENPEFTGTATLTFFTNDNGNVGVGPAPTHLPAPQPMTDTETITINVAQDHDAPVIVGSPAVTFGSIAEDAGTTKNPGSGPTDPALSISSMLTSAGAGAITFPAVGVESGAAAGIAVTAAQTTNGTWSYSLDGTNWTVFPAVANTNALLLSGGDWVKFVPNHEYQGQVTLSFVAWDGTVDAYTSQSNGNVATADAPGTTVDLTVRGSAGSWPFSSSSATATLTVSPGNDAPTLSSTSLTLPSITEDVGATADVGVQIKSSAIGAALAIHTTAEGGLLGIAVTGVTQTSNGFWQWSADDTNWNPIAAGTSRSTALLLDGNDWLRFLPNSEFSDPVVSAVPTLTFAGWDETWDSLTNRADPASTPGNPTIVDLTKVTSDPGGSLPFSESTPGTLPIQFATARLPVAPGLDAPSLTSTSITLPSIPEDMGSGGKEPADNGFQISCAAAGLASYIKLNDASAKL